ncbi:hypothetical protein F543_17000 [Bibersteinia trehalosi USDA-ARS-USMARC-189]|uniref:DUF3761 domain-containing protein n=3 Tax=Bibersteinia trehalosi TaxID=47735 RepID=W0R643_BIBTR|nr:hypothetical protein WQG_6730 [Bibersteinia trehalosi USDA-ARS-USMARC-192]AHG84562.1 hypothetical protein F543_17000 [Bibersteinia trehalosi USDA-ARS-USMARC-189]AHG85937.1 hypothetical protein F544_7060 [Bibersteinia trehalosi USDA-ARS-USMARC-190]
MIMQKLKFVTALVLLCGLSACVQRTPVEVVKAQTDNTVSSTIAKPPVIEQIQVPAGVTAICQDGSYSKATDNSVCIGNGGVKTIIGRYHSE